MEKKGLPGPVVATIGHSTRTSDGFLDILERNGVNLVVDVRTLPRSRHNPQFNRDTLAGTLQARGLGYQHMAALGGLKHPLPSSPNQGWHNASFRGFADYMRTTAFHEAIDQMVRLAATDRLAIMCAEALPWRCHRYLIADALLIRGQAVEHILGPGARRPHVLNPMARIVNGELVYPEPPAPKSG